MAKDVPEKKKLMAKEMKGNKKSMLQMAGKKSASGFAMPVKGGC